MVVKKRGREVGKTKRGKSTKLMAFHSPWRRFLLSRMKSSLSKLRSLKPSRGRRERFIGDLAFNSAPFDQRLAEQGIEMIVPHKRNRKRAAIQDGCALRRYK